MPTIQYCIKKIAFSVVKEIHALWTSVSLKIVQTLNTVMSIWIEYINEWIETNIPTGLAASFVLLSMYIAIQKVELPESCSYMYI